MERLTALVTGASGGIGYEFARILAKENYNLVVVARNENILKDLKKTLEAESDITVKVVAKDLSNIASVCEIYNELKKENIAIDVLVNNAGIGKFGLFSETDWHKTEEMININITTLTYFCSLFGKDMAARNRGRILNVASTAAFQPGPLMAVYYASKAYVLSFSEAIANEFKETGVTVTALCPGLTDTGFHERAGTQKSKLVAGKKMNSARDVALYGYRAMMKQKTVAVPGWKNRLLALVSRFAPKAAVIAAVRKMLEERRDDDKVLSAHSKP
ncbi:MAG: SDR family oxidoreductase [Nitrospirota bacterium]